MILLLLLGVCTAYVLQRFLFRHYWNHRLSADIFFSQACAYEGEQAFLREEIVNRGFLPLPALEVQFAISRNLIFSGESSLNSNITDQSYKRDIFSMLPNQKIIRRLSFQCSRRGFYEIKKSTITGYDFFFHASCQADYAHETQFYVLPAPVDTRRIQLLYQQISGMIRRQNRLFPDPYEFAGIREYTTSDSMRHINWKASARSQQLLVNQFDSTTSTKVLLYLDTEDRNILKEEELVEESIRIAASLSSRILKEHLELFLFNTSGYHFSSRNGSASITELNYGLAKLDASRLEESCASYIRASATEPDSSAVCILISKNKTTENIEAMSELSKKGIQTLWICPVSAGTQPEAFSAGRTLIHYWEVTR